MQTLRILIAENKEIVAARLTAQLRSLGHQVVEVARDARAAVTAAWQLKPDLILLGVRFPGRDGIEVARAILAQNAIPIILLTTYTAADLVERARKAGILAYLVTPAHTRKLSSAIEVALARFRELQALCEETGDLKQALRSWIVLEKAKGALMLRLGLSEPEAFRYMRGQSRSTEAPLGELAAGIVTAEELLFGRLNVVRYLRLILRTLGRGELFPPRWAA